MRLKAFIFGFFMIAGLFSACGLRPVLNEGTGMAPAIKDGDKILIDEQISDLKRGDIVMFLYPRDTSKLYVKRIVGLPGETVEIRAGTVFINNQPLEEPYLEESYNSVKSTFAPLVVPAGHFYVLGDNRDNSSDSRYWGTVSKDLLKGRYYQTYSPAEK